MARPSLNDKRRIEANRERNRRLRENLAAGDRQVQKIIDEALSRACSRQSLPDLDE
jgi:hypothetical protein